MKKILVLIFFNLLYTFQSISGNDVFGCGGFIKTQNSEIDFSKVEIKLLTKQGSVKDTTDCSPSNGYYFIPIYDKGEYILKVSPPPGWSFEPDFVELNFDGKTDICSLGKDVNFIFKGFGITGKIGIKGQSGGAKGVHIDLKSADEKLIGSTKSAVNGVFSFTPIIPGHYVIHVSHDKWHFVSTTYAVTVTSGNTELPSDALLISGYDVHIKSQIEGLDLVLFDKKGQNSAIKCKNNAKLTQTTFSVYKSESLCSASLTNSAYIFTAVPPGSYLVLPQFRNKDIKVNLNPQHLEIEVQRDSLYVADSFEITGLSVFGRVLLANGKGIENAVVTLNGNQQARTKNDGSYSFDNIKTGTYIVKVVGDNFFKFDDHTVKISMTNPVLPNIEPSAFKVCGQVVSGKSYKVVFQKHGSTVHLEQNSAAASGEFCVFVGNGKYSVNVETSETDKTNGIQFFPLTQNVEVSNGPLNGIVFSQLRATVTGDVKCLADADSSCHNINVNFHALDSNGNKIGQPLATAIKNGKYSFTEVLPGLYELSVSQVTLCWEKHVQRVTIKEAVHSVSAFKHNGYKVSIITSHADTHFKYTLRSSAEQKITKSLDLNTGLNQFCVANANIYDFTLSGCHIFDENQSTYFSTKDQNPVTITAVKHKHGVRILSEKSKFYKLIVEGESGQSVVDMKSEPNKVDGYFAYRHEFYLKPEESIKLTPINDEMLFKPESVSVIGYSDCVDNSQNFIATQGLVINGKTNPKIADAKITLTYASDLAGSTTKTDANGAFKFGPIDSSLEFTITAEKESYVFSDYDTATNTFVGYKLCEIIVSVKDEQGNKLSGVLLSLSGGESYRKNLVTGDDASINFHSLSPSQYYLRPMMKEYKFEPNSKMIEVGEGETINVELIGKRVAFSIFGAITSLNGDPFPNILVEAVAGDSCNSHQEEASSEFNGLYRIRGLQPNCKYSVRVKSSDASNANVDRTIPNEKYVTIKEGDVRDINIIAISPLSFVDVTARIMASSNDFYKTLKIQLYKKGQSDSPIHSQRVESPLNPKNKINPGIMVFFPRIPYDGKTYYIVLTTTLSEKNYKFKLPNYEFVANASSRFIEIDFTPENRVAESDFNSNSLAGLILIALVAFSFFRQDLALEFVNWVWSWVRDTVNKNSTVKKSEVITERFVDEREIDELAQSINAIKKKKTRKSN